MRDGKMFVVSPFYLRGYALPKKILSRWKTGKFFAQVRGAYVYASSQ